VWVHRFKLGFYAPAVLPILFGFMVTTMECIGDITATTEASELIPIGEEFETAIQGGVLADGLACIYGALGTTLPPVTYAQNNGVISLTRCAARRAGWMCGGCLIVLGVIAKFAGVILSIPDCVLGGMTTFLFINVTISGMRILTMAEGITRRNRFIAALSLSLGIGVELLPAFFNISGQFEYPNEGNFWTIDPNWSTAYRGFRDAIIIVLTSGFSLGGFTALIANLIIPHDSEELNEPKHVTAYSTGTLDGEKLPEEMEMTRDV
jgi:NCS2 family nucleobase:cation symporter-2